MSGNAWLEAEQNRTTVMPLTGFASNVAFRLTVLRGNEAGKSLTMDGSSPGAEFIGQSTACQLRLTDPTVSRRHASVDVDGNHLRLKDLASTNGTYLNGTRVIEALLVGGEEIQVGSTFIRVEVESEATPVALSPSSSFGSVIGESVAMRRLYPICERLAQSDVPLVIEGETGTGKEALAESLHRASPRARGPFVVFDCTAVHASLIESALFGHEKGAFTGAVAASAGVFEEANGGTLLIDEIGDLDKPLQAKLLRAIQSSEVRRVGGTKMSKFNVRILAATRRNLDAEVQAGRFRDDLFFRLAVTRITLPPLRERREDIEILAQHFWESHPGEKAALERSVIERFNAYEWPGNVRELANTVARFVALGDFAKSFATLFMQEKVPVSRPGETDFINGVVENTLAFADAREQVTREFERRYVTKLLSTHDGDIPSAVEASGIGERYLRMIRARVRGTGK